MIPTQLIHVFMTPDQVAERLQVKRTTVYRWLKSGAMRGNLITRKMWRITEEQLNEFVERGVGK
jgi:excisionase family DNA binding protein